MSEWLEAVRQRHWCLSDDEEREVATALLDPYAAGQRALDEA